MKGKKRWLIIAVLAAGAAARVAEDIGVLPPSLGDVVRAAARALGA